MIESDELWVQSTNLGTKSKKRTNLDGYSFPLCQKIIKTLEKSSINFHVQLLHVLDHNTRRDSQGNAYPIFHGFLVSLMFSNQSQCT